VLRTCARSRLDLATADDLVEATSDTGSFMSFSSTLKRNAMKLSKICNDLRLLSGPQAGLGEINLPAMQAGSSIMPGKVNPVIPEVVNQVAFAVAGADLTVTMASEAGQLQLNAFEPVIAHSIFQSITWMRQAMWTLRVNCVDGITANRDRLGAMVGSSVGVITALTPFIGYAASAALAKTALLTNRNVADLVVEAGPMSREEVTSSCRRAPVGPRGDHGGDPGDPREGPRRRGLIRSGRNGPPLREWRAVRRLRSLPSRDLCA
jgi:aspartate ammonia-lyase